MGLFINPRISLPEQFCDNCPFWTPETGYKGKCGCNVSPYADKQTTGDWWCAKWE